MLELLDNHLFEFSFNVASELLILTDLSLILSNVNRNLQSFLECFDEVVNYKLLMIINIFLFQ
jgi:hypothetical protein